MPGSGARETCVRGVQDARINWICNPTHKHREMRGVTSAGRKYRGLHGKGHLHTKCRPSRRATWKSNNAKKLRRYRCAHPSYATLLPICVPEQTGGVRTHRAPQLNSVYTASRTIVSTCMLCCNFVASAVCVRWAHQLVR